MAPTGVVPKPPAVSLASPPGSPDSPQDIIDRFEQVVGKLIQVLIDATNECEDAKPEATKYAVEKRVVTDLDE